MSPEEQVKVLAQAREMGLSALVELDPAAVLGAAKRAQSFAAAVTLEAGDWGLPWPPMQVPE